MKTSAAHFATWCTRFDSELRKEKRMEKKKTKEEETIQWEPLGRYTGLERIWIRGGGWLIKHTDDLGRTQLVFARVGVGE